MAGPLGSGLSATGTPSKKRMGFSLPLSGAGLSPPSPTRDARQVRPQGVAFMYGSRPPEGGALTAFITSGAHASDVAWCVTTDRRCRRDAPLAACCTRMSQLRRPAIRMSHRLTCSNGCIGHTRCSAGSVRTSTASSAAAAQEAPQPATAGKGWLPCTVEASQGRGQAPQPWKHPPTHHPCQQIPCPWCRPPLLIVQAGSQGPWSRASWCSPW